MSSDAKAIADKYIARDGGSPKEPTAPRPLVLSEQECRWLCKAISRRGWMPYRLRDGDDAPSSQQRTFMAQRGLIEGPPWRIAQHGREAVQKYQEIKRATLKASLNASSAPVVLSFAPERTLAEVERRYILSTLDECNGNRSKAARVLGISIRTVRNKLRSYAETI